jgi:hypothetical protein
MGSSERSDSGRAGEAGVALRISLQGRARGPLFIHVQAGECRIVRNVMCFQVRRGARKWVVQRRFEWCRKSEPISLTHNTRDARAIKKPARSFFENAHGLNKFTTCSKGISDLGHEDVLIGTVVPLPDKRRAMPRQSGRCVMPCGLLNGEFAHT